MERTGHLHRMPKPPLPFSCRSPCSGNGAAVRCLAPLLLAAACSAAPSAPVAPEPAHPSLLGQWRIVARDGREPVVGRDGRPPVLTFDEHSYGGYAGCNSFGIFGDDCRSGGRCNCRSRREPGLQLSEEAIGFTGIRFDHMDAFQPVDSQTCFKNLPRRPE